MKNRLFTFLILLGTLASIGPTFGAPLALVYKGAGSCVDGCSESPADILTKMGYEVQFVGPQETSFEVFKNAKLWIQPGGSVREQYKAMHPSLKSNIVKFVKNGGSYVGICAGGLLASEGYFWDSTKDGPFKEMGLNFFPGYSTIYQVGINPQGREVEIAIVPTLWDGVLRDLYWEGGPVFVPNKAWKAAKVETVSTYPNGYPATIRRKYHSGKVIVTAFHPEALPSWITWAKLTDKDGSDFDLLSSMITWAQ